MYLLAVGDEGVLGRALELDGGGAGVLGQPHRRGEGEQCYDEGGGCGNDIEGGPTSKKLN